MVKKWWHGKTAYQIYPKSFYDSNGDGIGDLPGIISKLDYLKDLGIDILWLSPIYASPLADQGYDISDYYRIDPRFGTMEDMDILISEAKKRDMIILMDLVVNHCSDEHEWFQKAIADPDGEYGNFFYLKEQRDGCPCNWRSYFGGSVWEPLPGTDRQYLHVFHKKQPDLNWENPKVRKEVYKNIDWWMKKGLGGFRIDAIINIKKPLPFRDYPADRDDGLCSVEAMLADAKGVGTFLGEMRDLAFQPHEAFTVGEVFNEKEEELPDFIGDNGYFSTMFDFRAAVFGSSDKGWYDRQTVTPDDYKRCCFESQKRAKNAGFLSNIIENHDEPRGVSRYLPEGEHSEAAKKMLGALYFMLRGLPFIYQGQEIGMENTVFSSIGEVDDISTLDEYQNAKNDGLSDCEALAAVSRFSRDNARTPMQWTGGPNAGFTSGTPWLKLNPNAAFIHVAEQEHREDSVLSFYKKLIALRKQPEFQETIVYGDLVPWLEDRHNLMAYYRQDETTRLLVIGNYQNDRQSVTLEAPLIQVLLNNYPDLDLQDNTISLYGYQVLILKLRTSSMNQKERMLAELPYKPWMDGLDKERMEARKKIYRYNNLPPEASEERESLLLTLLGKAGADPYIEAPFRCDYGYNIEIGSNFYANYNCIMLDVAKIRIGSNVMFAPNVAVYTAGHPIHPVPRNIGYEYGLEVTIGDNVWIGGNTVINPGVHIGSNVVIGSGSVVTKDIPDFTVAVGNPCRVVRTITEEDRHYYCKDRLFDVDDYQ